MNVRSVIMRLTSGFVAFAAGISIVAVAVNHEEIAVPPPIIPIDVAENWRRISASTFSFSVPPAVQERAVYSLCGSSWEFHDASLKLSVDYGLYSDNLSFYVEQPAYRAESITVDGREARLVTFRLGGDLAAHFKGAGEYVVAMYFPHANDRSGTSLTMWANCDDTRAQELAKQVFLTVKFNR